VIKVRVFKFEKNSNYDISSKITPVRVENSQGFNYIVINNPGEANCLCIVNKFALKTLESGNKAKLLISSHNGDSGNQMKLGSLDISCDLIEEECKENIELDTIELQKEQELEKKIDLLNGKYSNTCTKVVCKNCGNTLPSTSKYCHKCGKKI